MVFVLNNILNIISNKESHKNIKHDLLTLYIGYNSGESRFQSPIWEPIWNPGSDKSWTERFISSTAVKKYIKAILKNTSVLHFQIMIINAVLIKSFLAISVPNPGACMGKVPSPTNRFGCFRTVSAKSLFMNLDKSKVSSGFAWQAE